MERRHRAKQIAKSYKNVFPNADLEVPNQMAYEWDNDLRAMKWSLICMSEAIDYYKHRDGYAYNMLRIAFDSLSERVAKYNCIKMRKDKYPCEYGDECPCLITASSGKSAVGKIKTDEPDNLSTK